ncbi:PQQ-dependent sugar dehydrogenase [Aureivirga sp. CE67]|uniref:PQQ-dependent sugar dehydrogenase n=1 Tax=Aureivirga sp. CE67 TaxID=1788983 RepID=UPI0018C8E982|nr:PQQ-dependent sugar dehydrogenase [Aureivirga sp. CE67]
MRLKIVLITVLSAGLFFSCKNKKKEVVDIIELEEATPVNNTNLEIPEGFAATVFADDIGKGRHIVVNDNGDVYMSLRQLHEGKGIVALRDSTGDGKADMIEYFGDSPGTGLGIHHGYLYFSNDTNVFRYKFKEGELLPELNPELVISGFPEQDQHQSKPLSFDDKGHIFVDVGAPSNACMEQTRTPGSPGQDPCPELKWHGGVWRFDANKLGQTQQKDGVLYATGIRNAMAMDWNHDVNELYIVQHGRDQLYPFFPEYYDVKMNAELPAEEFLLVKENANFGWPYCYYDGLIDKKVLAPEYGGDGKKIGRCADMSDPVMAFPAHLAPNDLVFYDKEAFPEKYQKGAFIAFHGSWNRAPEKQEGYYVVFVPFNGELPSGDWEIFADGFSEIGEVFSPSDAKHRPVGVAVGNEGSLFVSDSVDGTIWKISYTK